MYTPHYGMNYVALRTAQGRHRAMEHAHLHDHPADDRPAPAHSRLRRKEKHRLGVLLVVGLIMSGCVAALWVGSL